MISLLGLAERGWAVPEEAVGQTCPRTSSTWAMASDFVSEVWAPLGRGADAPVVARVVTCVAGATVESAPGVPLGSACWAPPERRARDMEAVKWEEPRAHLPPLLDYTVLPLVAHHLLQG